MPRRLIAALAGSALIGSGLTALAVPGAEANPASAPAADLARPVGTVLKHSPLKKSLWVPGSKRAFKLTYVTTDPFGKHATSTGEVFVPKGKAPKGGWPVVSWAHGTSGLADKCAPSRVGPLLPERDFPYLATWMKQGYAIVASDYVGLGTPGEHPYLDAKAEAHSVVDMVKAGRNFSAAQLPTSQRLSNKWVVIGQSQGGGAAIATASYATEFGGKLLDFRGGVGTGTPAYIELLITALGPGVAPVDVSPDLSTYVAYILAGMNYVHPELDIPSALSGTGKKFLKLASQLCDTDMVEAISGTAIGDLFSQPLATLPGFPEAARDYMGMPETSFEKPIFMANGLIDTDVPMETTATYAAVLTANGADVTFKTYPTDHSGTMNASLPDSVPFVKALFAN